MNREKDLIATLTGIEQGEYFHFRAKLANIVGNVGIPIHQRDQVITKKKEIEWISDMLIYSMHVKNQSLKKPNYAVVNAFKGNFSEAVSGNFQRFGIWYNTDTTNGFPKYSLEEGAHRRRYYQDFVADLVKIKREVASQKNEYDKEMLTKLFDFCHTDEINYTTLKDMGLTGLIDDLEVEIDMIKTGNPEIASQMFRSLNNAVKVKGSDLRKNLYANRFLYKLIEDFFDTYSTKEAFEFEGVSYSADKANALRFILPTTIASKGKYFDIMCRCILINKNYKDGCNWTGNTKNQAEIADNLFNRYNTDRQHRDMTTVADFNDTIQKLIKLGEILINAQKDESSFLFAVGDSGHNYTTGAVGLHSAFILAFNDLSVLYPKATIDDYAKILKTFSNALIVQDRKYVSYNTTTKIIKDTPYRFNRMENAAGIITKIAKDILVR